MYDNPSSLERFLVVHGSSSAWAMRTDHVVRFETLAQWQGPPPLTAQWSDSLSGAPLPTRCLLVFRTWDGEQAIRITGTVSMCELEPRKVSPLPAPCRPPSTAELVLSGVAVDQDRILFLLLAPSEPGTRKAR